MTDATIIDKLGGSAELARQLGAPLTTVDSWKRADRIPHWRRPAVAEVARRKGVKLPATFEQAAAA